MSEERYPSASWQHTVTGEFGERITVVAYEDGQHHPGSVTIDVDEQGKKPANILLARPEQREEFARAWMEACRRADGEPPAGEAREHG